MLKNYTLLVACLLMTIFAQAQGSESFTSMPAGQSSYAPRTWTGDNGLPWNATDARTDQTITASNPAITIRNGAVTCDDIPGGITAISFRHQQEFGGSGGSLEVYINGSLAGTASPTAAEATASFDLTSLNVTGIFDLEIRQVTAGLRISIDDITWVGFNNFPACIEPAAQPTNLLLTSTPNSITGNFTAPVPDVNAYLIIRSTAATLSATPVDGTVYTVGQAFGGGTVIGYSSINSFTDNTLNPSTTYYYFVFCIE